MYANRRRVRGEYGKSLLRRRGELVERSFAHCYETGAMRRCHLRGQENIWKRQLIHVGAFNLSLIQRQLLGAGTPREWKNRFGSVLTHYLLFPCRINKTRFCKSRISASLAKCFVRSRSRLCRPACRKSATCTPGCYTQSLMKTSAHLVDPGWFVAPNGVEIDAPTPSCISTNNVQTSLPDRTSGGREHVVCTPANQSDRPHH